MKFKKSITPLFRNINSVAFGIILLFNLINPERSYAQDSLARIADSTCVQKDVGDVIRAARNMAPKTDDNDGSLLLIPIIGSNPATGFMIGVGGQYAFKMEGEKTLYSLLSGSFQLTTKNQTLFMVKNSVFTKDNRFLFTGDWRFLIFSQETYGLGTNSPNGGILDYQYNLGGVDTTIDSLAQPMNFNFIRFYQSASYRLNSGLYVGVGYYLDSYFKIEDQKLRLGPTDSVLTSNYAYNMKYGFNPKEYYISSLSLNLTRDTRDNMINPYKGYYANVSWRAAPKFFGNKENVSFLHFEWRSFHPLSKRNPRHLIAFWGMGDFTSAGAAPYLILPATAYDQRGRSARGYTQGRFRGNNLVYGEAEYRFPISSCGGILGGVLFMNATTANNKELSLKLFESVKPGYGVGLRVMVDKKTRTNLAIDFGMGDQSSGFYLAASETF
ncbi:MAG TPA: BamA/TamA family outer membrane protein [Cyclobacteriaceae bacterium]